jgi:hypothetical protein
MRVAERRAQSRNRDDFILQKVAKYRGLLAQYHMEFGDIRQANCYRLVINRAGTIPKNAQFRQFAQIGQLQLQGTIQFVFQSCLKARIARSHCHLPRGD